MVLSSSITHSPPSGAVVITESADNYVDAASPAAAFIEAPAGNYGVAVLPASFSAAPDVNLGTKWNLAASQPPILDITIRTRCQPLRGGQDSALSRRQHGFESRWGYQLESETYNDSSIRWKPRHIIGTQYDPYGIVPVGLPTLPASPRIDLPRKDDRRRVAPGSTSVSREGADIPDGPAGCSPPPSFDR